MHGVALLLTVAALGVDYGWQPGEDGQLEYIIQIEPELVDTLAQGKVDLLSEIPEELQGVKRFRIRVGKGPVPRKGLEEARASGALKPDGAASQPPNLPGDPRASTPRPGTTTRPGETTPPGSSPGRVLSPPGNNTPALPGENDRFAGGGGSFPSNNNNPPPATGGIRNDWSNTGFNNTQPPANSYPANDGGWQTGGTNNRWADNATGWGGNNPGGYAPDASLPNPGMAPVNDPRYAPRGGLPEVRRDMNQDPRYAGPPTANPGWGNAPLRDPDYGMYPDAGLRDPRAYDPGPYGRQVDYREVASRPAPTTPPASSNTTPVTTPAPAAPEVAKTSPRSSADRFSGSEEAKPWLPLTFTAMLLFASVGLNFYLGWIANGIYLRYRALLMEVRNVRAAAI